MRAWCALLFCACGPIAGDVRTEALVRGADGVHRVEEVTLHRVKSLATLEGERMTFAAGAELKIEFDLSRGCALNGLDCDAKVSELREVVIGERRTSVRPRFALNGGVYRPLDFDTLNLVTAYRSIDEAQEFFAALAVDPSATAGPAPVYYYPNADSLEKFNLSATDNAAYFQLVDGFLVLPMEHLEKVPFSMNKGVVFHEYFHRVFALRVFGERALRAFLAADLPGFQSILRLRAVNEGLADFFGAIGADDPDFIAASLSQRVADTRNPAFTHTMQADWLDASGPAAGDQYDPYPPGSCFASFLWQAQASVGRDPTIAAWFLADQAIAAKVETRLRDVTFPFVVNAIVLGFAGGDRAAVCGIAKDVFSVFESELSACP